LPKDQGIIIAGDFNALAQTDKDAYNTVLLDLLMIEGKLEPKSGLPIVKGRTIYRHNLDNGQLDYTVTSMPLKNGMYDAVSKMNATFVSSAPIHLYQKENSHLLRIDYVFVNEILVGSLKQAEIIKDSVTDSLSDHYPVWVEMQNPR
jgi:exodeoxyribonuclease-3